MEFQLASRADTLALEWKRTDGSLALFTWGRTALWDERNGPDWLIHLGQTVTAATEPVAGLPGPVASLIAAFRLSASEYWRFSDVDPRLAVDALAVFHDAGIVYVVAAGNCRVFRARERREIFLIEPVYSERDQGAGPIGAGENIEQVTWGQDLPRPGDVYLLAAGLESEPSQGLRDYLMDSAGDMGAALKYCRGMLLMGPDAAILEAPPPKSIAIAAGYIPPGGRAVPEDEPLRLPDFLENLPTRSTLRSSESPRGAQPGGVVPVSVSGSAPPPAAPIPSAAESFAPPAAPLPSAAEPSAPAAQVPAAFEPVPPPARPASPTHEPASDSPKRPMTRPAPTFAETQPPPEPAVGWRRYAGYAALALVVGLIAWMSLGRGWMPWRHAPWAPASLSVVTEPEGARVKVDGREVGSSPLQLEVKPGKHFVEARLGDLGVDTQTFALKAGETAQFRPRFAGQVSIGNTHPGLPLYAQLDGSTADSVPVVWKDVPAGRHLVSFSGPGVLSWTAEVRVTSGQVTTYDAQPQTTAGDGGLEVTSMVVGNQGLKESKGDAVRVDWRPAGRTPFRTRLPIGIHSVRVERAGELPQIQLIDLKAGQDRYVKVEFDGSPRARVDVAPPFGTSGYPLVAAVFHPAHRETMREMRLYYASPEQTVFVRRTMTLLDKDKGVYAAPLPALGEGRASWKYYVVAVDGDFNEIPSEVLVYGKALK
ncbi:MAG: PEGA domain-containing protein [Candidatus Eisenbacteria bacterium]|nr:PEGA domain-containing protein [Candidatus Eisenbacteria bacterium]